jgi:hypothetical protein
MSAAIANEHTLRRIVIPPRFGGLVTATARVA